MASLIRGIGSFTTDNLVAILRAPDYNDNGADASKPTPCENLTNARIRG